MSLDLAIAFGALALPIMGIATGAFPVGVPVPIPMGLGRCSQRASTLSFRVRLRRGVTAVVTGVTTQARRVGDPKVLPSGPVSDMFLDLEFRCHSQTLAEDVTRESPCFDKEVGGGVRAQHVCWMNPNTLSEVLIAVW